MRRRILVITDLWGMQGAGWLHSYITPLRKQADVIVYDSKQLGEIDEHLNTEGEIHQAFVAGGLDKAVENLLGRETALRTSDSNEALDVLGFSIGGTIAWKAALAGLEINHLVALSATRLRKETEHPFARISLLYGDKEDFRPDIEWERKMSVECIAIPSKGHDFYKEQQYAERVIRILLADT